MRHQLQLGESKMEGFKRTGQEKMPASSQISLEIECENVVYLNIMNELNTAHTNGLQ